MHLPGIFTFFSIIIVTPFTLHALLTQIHKRLIPRILHAQHAVEIIHISRGEFAQMTGEGIILSAIQAEAILIAFQRLLSVTAFATVRADIGH